MESEDGLVVRLLKIAVVVPIVIVLAIMYAAGRLFEHIKRIDQMPMSAAVGLAIPFIIIIAMLVFGRFEGI